jgi:hypothetical protein
MESTSWRSNDCLNNLWMCDYGLARCIVGVLDGSIYTYVQQLNSKPLEMLPVARQIIVRCSIESWVLFLLASTAFMQTHHSRRVLLVG